MQKPIVFFIDDDEDFLLECSLLMETNGYRVRIFTSGPQFLNTYKHGDRGCAVIDARMPEMSGMELQAEMSARRIDIPIIFLTGYADVDMAVQAMKGGAVEFLQKPVNESRLIKAITKAVTLDSDIAISKTEVNLIQTRMESLTNKERQVLVLLATGLQNNEIASHLNRSEKTIELHITKILRKMDARNRTEIVRMITRVASDTT